jgi:hypothetical protein
MIAAKELNQKFMAFSGEVSAEKLAVHTIFHDPALFNATISRSILRNSILFHARPGGANTAF